MPDPPLPGRRPATEADARPSGLTPAGARGPSLPRAVAFGVGAAIVGAAGWWLTGGLFALTAGLLVVSAAVGWLVGTGVAWGAWGERAHAPDPRLRVLAMVFGLVAWLVGSFAVYVFELSFLPQSHLPLLTKMTQLPFLDFTLQQFMPYGPFELILIAIFAWRAAR